MNDSYKILLDKGKSKESSESLKTITLDISNTTRLIPNDDISSTLSLYNLYTAERDACNRYRLIVTVNPICSNVLFNRVSEILSGEGSDNCNILLPNYGSFNFVNVSNKINTTNQVTHLQALQDTEYSHPNIGNLVYHCGVDIFDNHLLRGTSFERINAIKKPNEKYNTINDELRNNLGEIVIEAPIELSSVDTVEVPMHVYSMDNFYTFQESFDNNCIERNGWFGFVNTTSIDIPNGKIKRNKVENDLTINKVLNNNKACEFIDLYPDRTLFSFIPKYNKVKNRAEKNWECTVMYPYKSDFDKFNEISRNLGTDTVNILNAELIHGSGDGSFIRCLSHIRHTLKPGEFIRLYYIRECDMETGGTLTRHYLPSEIFMTGDSNNENQNRYFSLLMQNFERVFVYVRNNNFEGFILRDDYSIDKDGNYDGSLNKKLHFFYKKEESGVECKYYFRKARKVKNSNNEDLTYSVNKLAYGENIYGDRFAQVIFTDDINVEGLVDNLGRKVSELYFTSIKTNKGWKEWYNENNYSDDSIEYSHCFGKVTSGLDLPVFINNNSNVDDSSKDYNIRCIHNVGLSADTNGQDITFNLYKQIMVNDSEDEYRLPKTIEDDISMSDEELYLDLVEFSSSLYEERVLEKVYHRVNTAQRETLNERYNGIIEHELLYDDYDTPPEQHTSVSFTVTTANTRDISIGSSEYTYNVNICPEGYFYDPFDGIKIHEYSESISTSIPRIINYPGGLDIYIDETDTAATIVNVISPKNYGFAQYDNILLLDKDTDKTYWGYINLISATTFDGGVLPLISIKTYDSLEIGTGITKYVVVYPDGNIGSGAVYIPEKNYFIWRDLLELSQTPISSEIYNMPFTNGRLYLEKNVDFYMRRQDPTNIANLSRPKPVTFNVSEEEKISIVDNMRNFSKAGNNAIDFSAIFRVLDNIKDIC